MIILFDYGHGGKDPGAVYKGRLEANDVLHLGQAVAMRLRTAGIIIDETWYVNTKLDKNYKVSCLNSTGVK